MHEWPPVKSAPAQGVRTHVIYVPRISAITEFLIVINNHGLWQIKRMFNVTRCQMHKKLSKLLDRHQHLQHWQKLQTVENINVNRHRTVVEKKLSTQQLPDDNYYNTVGNFANLHFYRIKRNLQFFFYSATE